MRFPSGFSLKLVLLIIITSSWIGLIFTLNPGVIAPPMLIAILIFALLSALLSVWLLEVFDHFNTFHPIAGPDALLTLIVALPLAATASKYLVLTALGVVVTRYRDIFVAAPIVCGLSYAFQVLGGIVFVRSGAKRKLCILTSREEAAKVLKALRSKLLSKYYQPIFLDDIQELRNAQGLTWIVISRSEMRLLEKNEAVIEAMLMGTEIVDYREFISRIRGHLELASLDGWTFLTRTVKRNALGRTYYLSKTLLEPIFCFSLLILLLPFLILVGLAVKLTSAGPILYGQTRLGYQGRPFKLWKFRSMRSDAEKQGHKWSVRGDSRITRFGIFLRKSRIDELPQLWNIARGEMSLIGPRPERPEFYTIIEKEIPLFPTRLLVRPGITGWAQVMGGYAATMNQTRRKLEYDLFYLQRMSPKMDAIIALKTLVVAVSSLL
jgi:lipopolysaccharide/colanic/teichoic acid biosynthesis glycosyltransferase